jgi:hypothetical protein
MSSEGHTANFGNEVPPVFGGLAACMSAMPTTGRTASKLEECVMRGGIRPKGRGRGDK